MISISDDKSHIVDTLWKTSNTVDLVIVTGGLGPTKDDVTKRRSVTILRTLIESSGSSYQNYRRFLNVPLRRSIGPGSCSFQMHRASQSGGDGARDVDEKETPFYFAAGSAVWNEVFGWKRNHSVVKEYERPYIIHKTILTYGQRKLDFERIEAWENSRNFWNWLTCQVRKSAFTYFG
jgi:nicotinamide-nucleotide amidase